MIWRYLFVNRDILFEFLIYFTFDDVLRFELSMEGYYLRLKVGKSDIKNGYELLIWLFFITCTLYT